MSNADRSSTARLKNVVAKTTATFNRFTSSSKVRSQSFLSSVVLNNVAIGTVLNTKRYSITYFGNTNTDGIPPIDMNIYTFDDNATIQSSQMVKQNYQFMRWNTLPNGKGISYYPETIILITNNLTLYAVWFPLYNITYVSTYTSGIVPLDSFSPYTEGTIVTVKSPTTVQTGYYLVSWNLVSEDSSLYYPVGSTFPIMKHTTLYAVWGLTHTITYVAPFTSGAVPIDTIEYPFNALATIKEPGTLQKLNYRFVKWSEGTLSVYPNSQLEVTRDITLTAVWESTYTVTYDGTQFTSGTLPIDENVYVYDNIVSVQGIGSVKRTNHRFIGWNTQSDGLGNTYLPRNRFNITTPTILFAMWELLYTVTYYSNYGTGAVPIDTNSPYIYGNTAVVQGEGSLVFPNHRLIGWNSSGTVYSPTNTFPVLTNISMYAVWEELYSVTYVSNEDSTGDVPVDENSPYLSENTVTVKNAGSLQLTNYQFVGWSNGSDTYTPSTTFIIEDHMIFYAIWEPLCTVTYVSTATGSVVDTLSPYIQGNTVIVKTGDSLQLSNFRFDRWNTGSDGSGTFYSPYDRFEITNNMTLHAMWNSVYSVTYMKNSDATGNVPVDENTYISGETVYIKELGNLVLANHSFLKWSTTELGEDSDSYYPIDTFEISTPMTFYAIWVPIRYKVTYVGTYTEGSLPAETTYPYQTIVSVYGSIVRTGYTFIGWNTSYSALNVLYPFGQTNTFEILDDTTLYAIWSINTYTLDYDPNALDTTGSVPTSSSHTYNTSVQVQANEIYRIGYTFDGWNTVSDGSGNSYSRDSRFYIVNNTTLYVKWKINSYTVTYNSNFQQDGVTDTATPISFDYGSPISLVARSLIKTGWTFLGWNTSTTASTALSTPYNMPANNLPLYAVWGYNVTYYGNGNTSGTSPTTIATTPGGTLSNGSLFSNTGWTTFQKWNTSSNITGIDYAASYQNSNFPASNITLYAVWGPAVTINYSANDGSFKGVETSTSTTHSVFYNQQFTTRSSAIAVQYTLATRTFKEWNTSADGSGTPFTDNVAQSYAVAVRPGNTQTLYAIWRVEITYAITGGSSYKHTVKYKNTDNIIALPFVDTGLSSSQTFGGWLYNGTTYQSGTTILTVNLTTPNITVTAVWQGTFTLTYNNNGGAGTFIDPLSPHSAGTISLRNPKTSFTNGTMAVARWALNSPTGTQYIIDSTYNISSNTVFYAIWGISITYVNTGFTTGTVPDIRGYLTSDNITTSSNTGNLMNNNYVVYQWSTAANENGRKLDFNEVFTSTSNQTLYPVWRLKVTYDKNYTGSAANVIDYYAVNTNVVGRASSTFNRTGYTPYRWNTAADGTGTYYVPLTVLFATSANSSPLYLYMIWNII